LELLLLVGRAMQKQHAVQQDREVLSVFKDTPIMTHQEIFKRLVSILNGIEENTKMISGAAFGNPQEITYVKEWKKELEELKEKVKEAIK